MPGIIMETNMTNGAELGGGAPNLSNGVVQQPVQAGNKGSNAMQSLQIPQMHLSNGPVLPNGVQTGPGEVVYGNGNGASTSQVLAPLDAIVGAGEAQWPPDIPRVPAEGFYSLATMISRACQRCLGDLAQLIDDLEKIDVPQQNSISNSIPGNSYVNGTTPNNQSPQNLDKKDRILKFAGEKRAQFIKLLVLSQWSRQSEEVRQAIDIRVWLVDRIQLYAEAINEIGEMKRRLAKEKMPPPDLDTAVEVLSTGKLAAMPDLGMIPRKPLSAKKILKTLKKINTLLSIKVILLDDFPPSFRNYRIHDGRVTFIVQGEFEVDLTIADEDRSSQLYFIDLRFLFTPSSLIPDGFLREEIAFKTNEILKHEGLTGCFDYLHDLVMTFKIGQLRKLGVDMARGQWTESLMVDQHHRTLVVQYWAGRPTPKSWVEIGINSGRRRDEKRRIISTRLPFVDIRWLREKKEQDKSQIRFDTENLNLDSTMRSVVALHISHILRSIYDKLMEEGIYKNGTMGLKLTTSPAEPLDCFLGIQLTQAKALKVVIEPTTGRVVLQPPSAVHSRFEQMLNNSKDLARDGGAILAQLRCASVQDDVEYRARTMCWEVFQVFKIPEVDRKRFLPKDMVQYSVLRQRSWKRGWFLLSTHGRSGDLWWIIQVEHSGFAPPSTWRLHSARTIDPKYIEPPSSALTFEFFARLGLVATGLITVSANCLALASLKVAHEVEDSKQSTNADLPYIIVTFEPSKLPSLLPRIKGSKIEPWCRKVIRLSFQGLGHMAASSKLVAQGRLTRSHPGLVRLNANSDNSISFNPNNNSFSFHFTTAIGVPVGRVLLNRLQRLERLIETLAVFKRHKLTTDYVSISHVVFSYSTRLRAHINFDYNEPVISIKLDIQQPPPAESTVQTPKTRSKSKMIIDFNKGNPHLKIKDHLTDILNNAGGLEEVSFLLTATLPTLQGLDEIEQTHHQNQSQTQPSVQNPPDTAPIPCRFTPEALLLYRAADWYGLNYYIRTPAPQSSQPKPLAKFDLRLKSRRDKTIWLLTNTSAPEELETASNSNLATKLADQIFTATGPGWRGMSSGVVVENFESGNEGPGAVAGAEGVGVSDLLRKLDGVVTDAVGAMEVEAERLEGDGGGEKVKVEGKGHGDGDRVIMIE